jgi:predicted nucleic acid-binding protein
MSETKELYDKIRALIDISGLMLYDLSNDEYNEAITTLIEIQNKIYITFDEFINFLVKLNYTEEDIENFKDEFHDIKDIEEWGDIFSLKIN